MLWQFVIAWFKYTPNCIWENKWVQLGKRRHKMLSNLMEERERVFYSFFASSFFISPQQSDWCDPDCIRLPEILDNNSFFHTQTNTYQKVAPLILNSLRRPWVQSQIGTTVKDLWTILKDYGEILLYSIFNKSLLE